MSESNRAPTSRSARAGRRGWPRRWLVNLLLILLVYGGVQWYKTRTLASGEAPPLAATALTNTQPFDLADWRGRSVLVHFWANWCPICRATEGGVDDLSRDFSVITVALHSGDAAEINQYLREHELDFPVIADPTGEIASAWGVRGVPTSFVLDGEGRVRFVTAGYTTGLGLRGRLWIADLLD